MKAVCVIVVAVVFVVVAVAVFTTSSLCTSYFKIDLLRPVSTGMYAGANREHFEPKETPEEPKETPEEPKETIYVDPTGPYTKK